MNKKQLTMISFGMLFAATLYGGSIDTKSNLSTGYLRNPSRNTEDSRPESALYNLAGTGFMKQGFSAEVGNQFVFKTYTNEPANAVAKKTSYRSSYKDEKPVLLYPNVDMVYRFGDFAASATFHIAAGGGSLDYKDGTALTSSLLSGAAHSLEVTSITYAETLGLAYNWRDKVSLAMGIRFLEATQSMDLETSATEIGYDAKGFGVGGIFGVQYKPIKALDLSLQYKTITKTKMEMDNIKGSTAAASFGLKDGKKFNNDLPSELNLGVGYQVIDSLYLSSSFNYYFNKHADMGSAISSKDSDWDDSWEVALGVDWQLTDKILLSSGVLYCDQGYEGDVNNVFGPVLNSVSYTAGIEYQAWENLAITYGAMYTMYIGDDYTYTTPSYSLEYSLDKSVFQMALSATYSF